MLVSKGVVPLPIKRSAGTERCCWLWGGQSCLLELEIAGVARSSQDGGRKLA